jgi:hypothetical protein
LQVWFIPSRRLGQLAAFRLPGSAKAPIKLAVASHRFDPHRTKILFVFIKIDFVLSSEISERLKHIRIMNKLNQKFIEISEMFSAQVRKIKQDN